MQEVYSLDEDGVYTDDECFDIETLLTDTKTFMTQLDIVLGDPEEAPSLVSGDEALRRCTPV